MFDTKLAAHLAELSKLAFTENELNQITKEMNDIIKLMDAVSDFEDNSVTTVNSAVSLGETRKDQPENSLPREDVLKNSAKSNEGCFAVPKVV